MLGSIVKSNAGSKFGYALSVPNAPETGALMITKFNATITKKSKAALARCKSKTMTWQRKVTYHDGTSETAEITQKCKRKKKGSSSSLSADVREGRPSGRPFSIGCPR